MSVMATELVIEKVDVNKAIDEKIEVLRDFYVVDDHNEEIIKTQLYLAVNDNPNRDVYAVLDQVAFEMIMEKLED